MKFQVDPKTRTPEFVLEEKDLVDARDIKVMMETEGWKRLEDYWALGRETIIEHGKAGVSDNVKKEQSAEQWAILRGYDNSKMLPVKVVERAEEYKKKQDDKEKEERDHGNRDFGGD